MSIELRDGTTTEDPRLDRLIQFDERSRAFPIRATIEAEKQPRNWRWRCDITLDQGREGACVGFACAHELAGTPVRVEGLTNEWARRLYYEAQNTDPWPGGEYPGAAPRYSGTSVLAGVKALQRRGFCIGYRWAFGLNDLILGVGYKGPAIIGINWYRDMYDPDAQGLIRPTGGIVGGHCIVVRGVVPTYRYFVLRNSWGLDWGKGGDCYVSFDDMQRLLAEMGEVCFLEGRRNAPL